MGNTHVRPHPLPRSKKQVHWKAADRPSPPGKPQLISENDVSTPDLITIRWGKPSNDGGSPISGYLVEHRRTGSPHWVRATPLMVQLPEITISGLEPGWRYQFRVRAENAVGLSDPSELSEPITVTLQRNAITVPRFIEELQDAVGLENEKIEFVVHFVGQPAPRVCWFKDGFEIFSSRRIRIQTDTERSILTIYQCALSDEGEIKCTATNRAGHVSTKAKLTLEAPPTIRLPRQYEDGLLFEIGESIRLKVTIAGRPTPLVFWTHNGESIRNSDRYELESNDRSSILKIDAAERNDRGEYQIKAVNKLGEDVTSFLVTVTDKPLPPGKAKVIMTLGRSVTLSWSTPPDDGGCKIGSYIVEYYRLGWDVWLKAATSRQLTTILGDLIEGSEYKFRVKAESPYGISEPSEESDVIFIPDPKRGIMEPGRARSQPRDIMMETGAPVAAKRKKPRSQSSSRVEEKSRECNITNTIFNAGIPVRPERNKLKSPSITPEASPQVNRKEMNSSEIKAIFDRDSIARDLAYGSPDFKINKELKENFNMDEISVTPSTTITSKISSPASSNHGLHLNNEKQSSSQSSRSPSPSQMKSHSPKENNEHFEGSSEFMLVLYPDENKEGHGSTSDITFDFEDSVPPPMSLSAPELGIEPPPMLFQLKFSASSTELLHERAMMRFIKAAEAEEAELEKRRRSSDSRKLSVDIPKIQINSRDAQDIVGLERKHSLRRRLSAGTISHQQALWAQRRQSLRNPNDFEDNIQNKLQKFPGLLDYKQKEIIQRQRSTSEEMEDEEFEKIRLKTQRTNPRFEKRTIPIVDEEKWDDEYEESLSETDSDFSENEKEISETSKLKLFYEDDTDEETYNPGRGVNLTNPEEPFEILTVKKNLPDPNFVPKPILKKSEHDEIFIQEKKLDEDLERRPKKRSHSPMPQNLYMQTRERSKSIAINSSAIKNVKPERNKLTSRPRSNSLFPENQIQEKQKELEKTFIETNLNKSKTTFHHISDVAESSVMTAASVVIPEKLIDKKKDMEETKVVIDHYGDIVRSYSQKNKSTHQPYLDRDKLKEMAEDIEPDEEDILSPSKENVSFSRERKDSNSSGGYGANQTSNDKDFNNYYVKPSSSKSSLSEGYKTSSCKSSISEDYNSRPRRSSLTDSYDSLKDKRSMSPRSKRTPSVSPARRFNKTKRPVSKSPARIENWNTLKSEQKNRKSPSPSRPEIKRKSKSPSPMPLAKHKPKLREIMTQTSVGFESFSNESYSRSSTPSERSQRQEELIAQAEVKVRGVIEYLTDLAMFVVACWLYLFQNELLAIPVLFVMVFRQIQSEVARRIPNWIKKRFNRKNKKSN